jgi:deazaflavin-dependent oxidoreductase (nitroreductase family)
MDLLKTNLVKNALASKPVVWALMKIVPPLDKFLLRISRGWLNTGMQPVALIATIGAKSGKKRDLVALCMPVDLDLILVASNWGREKNPAWYANLLAHPRVQVTFRGYRGPMVASEANGREREELWARLIQFNPQFARYQQGISRQIPVMVLSRFGAGEDKPQ